MAGIALGNEPDLTYCSANLERYLSDYLAYAGRRRRQAMAAPGARHEREHRDLAEHPGSHDQDPLVLGLARDPRPHRPGGERPRGRARGVRDRPLLPAGAHAAPAIRTAARRSSACSRRSAWTTSTIEVYTHAEEAARRGLRYRMDETNTAAGRGAQGVSDVAASATWTLETLFNAACPQPPDEAGANADCHLGATGVNVHNAEVQSYFFPQEGNAYYNAIRYDPTRGDGHADRRAVVLRAAAVRRAGSGNDRPAPAGARRGPARGRCGPRTRSGACSCSTPGRRRSRSMCRRPGRSARSTGMTPFDADRCEPDAATPPTSASTAGRSRPTGPSPG